MKRKQPKQVFPVSFKTSSTSAVVSLLIFVCLHPLLYWLRCMRKFGFVTQHMNEETSWQIMFLDDLRVLPAHSHPPWQWQYGLCLQAGPLWCDHREEAEVRSGRSWHGQLNKRRLLLMSWSVLPCCFSFSSFSILLHLLFPAQFDGSQAGNWFPIEGVNIS